MVQAQIYYSRYRHGNVAGITGTNYCAGYIYVYGRKWLALQTLRMTVIDYKQ